MFSTKMAALVARDIFKKYIDIKINIVVKL